MSVTARAVVRAAFILSVSIVASAVAQPAWVVDATTDAFNVSDGATGWAYVEAFDYPAGMEQIDTGLFVVCDVEAPDGYAAVQALPCAEQAAAARDAAASDPFADAPAADPFADAPAADPFADAPPSDPFADAPPSDPFADAPAVEPNPGVATRGAPAADPSEGDALDDFLAHPVTGLVTFGYAVADFEPLPPMAQPNERITTDDGYELLTNGDAAATYRALGGGCMADGAGLNGWIVDLASPGLDAPDGTYYAWLFADGVEAGALEVKTYATEDAVYGFLRWDADEVGLRAAFRAYDSLDVVLVDDLEAVVDDWRVDALVVRSMFDGLPCAQ